MVHTCMSNSIVFSASMLASLWQSISPINHTHAPRLISTRVARKVQKQSLYLLRMPLASQDRHAICLIKHLRSRAELGLKKARRNDIDSGKLAPLSSKRLAKMLNAGFRGIIDLDRKSALS
jgi:hypothetical protein